MGITTSVGYTPAMPRREDHEVQKGHVVKLEKECNATDCAANEIETYHENEDKYIFNK